MANEIEKPQSLEELVRGKVRIILAESIPQEQIDSLIGKEWDNLFKKQSTGGYHSTKTAPSVFEELVQRELQKQVAPMMEEKVTAYLGEIHAELQERIDSMAREVTVSMVARTSSVIETRKIAEVVDALLGTITDQHGQRVYQKLVW